MSFDDQILNVDNYIFNKDSIYDILNATVDPTILEGVADSMLEFKDPSTIVLYTSLNKTNTELLKNNQYNKLIIAFEYPDLALGIGQSEYIIKLVYNTNKLFDTLHPLAYQEIENVIKQSKLKKSELQDMNLFKCLLSKDITGLRVHSIDPTHKCYTKTHTIFQNSKLAYIVKPTAVKILGIKSKE